DPQGDAMRRKWTSIARQRRSIGHKRDIREFLEPEQLQNFAASCLTWNRIENAINVAVAFCLSLPPSLRLEVVSRINGFDGKTAILHAALRRHFRLADPSYNALAASLGDSAKYRRFRDGIAHAYVVDPNEPVAMTAQRQGKLDEVLITKDALGRLNEHL